MTDAERKAATAARKKRWEIANRERLRESWRLRTAKWRAANSDKVRAINAASREKNKEKLRPAQKERSAKWHNAHRAEANARRREHHRKNRRVALAAMKVYREANAEKVRAIYAAWAAAHPNSLTANANRRRARQHAAPGSHTGGERAELFVSYHGLCVYCGDRASVADHVDPIARGGSNGIENLVPACKKCNRSKSTASLLVWLAKRGPKWVAA